VFTSGLEVDQDLESAVDHALDVERAFGSTVPKPPALSAERAAP